MNKRQLICTIGMALGIVIFPWEGMFGSPVEVTTQFFFRGLFSIVIVVPSFVYGIAARKQKPVKG